MMLREVVWNAKEKIETSKGDFWRFKCPECGEKIENDSEGKLIDMAVNHLKEKHGYGEGI